MKRITNRTTEITIERRRSLVTRRTTKRRLSYCPICAREGEFVTPQDRWLEDGRFHFIEQPGSELFICSESLA